MIDATLFIGTVIAGITQLVKLLSPKVSGVVTILVALLVGVIVAIIDTQVGVADISIAQGIMIAFGTVGVVAVVEKVSNPPTRQ